MTTCIALVRDLSFFQENNVVCHVACGISVPQPGIESRTPPLEVQNPHHWIVRGSPNHWMARKSLRK